MDISINTRWVSGVYIIINIQTNKIYIGSSKNIYNRLHGHLSLLRSGRHHNKHIQSSFNIHGKDNFKCNILEVCSEEDRFDVEQVYINKYLPEYNKSFNVLANLGVSPSEESRAKASATLKLKYKSGVISAYKQDHLWENRYVYDIHERKLVRVCKNLNEALKFCGVKKVSKANDLHVISNRYLVSKNKFNNEEEATRTAYLKGFKLRGRDCYIRIEDSKNYRYCESLSKASEISGLKTWDLQKLVKNLNSNSIHKYNNSHKIIITREFI